MADRRADGQMWRRVTRSLASDRLPEGRGSSRKVSGGGQVVRLQQSETSPPPPHAGRWEPWPGSRRLRWPARRRCLSRVHLRCAAAVLTVLKPGGERLQEARGFELAD